MHNTREFDSVKEIYRAQGELALAMRNGNYQKGQRIGITATATTMKTRFNGPPARV